MPLTGTLIEFRALFPEFDPVSDVTVQPQLDQCTEDLSETAWGKCYGKAILYCAAHEIALSQNRQANATVNAAGLVGTTTGAGAITGASAGGISASFSQSATQSTGSDADVYLSKTEYGQRFIALKRQCLSTARIARRMVNVCPVQT